MSKFKLAACVAALSISAAPGYAQSSGDWYVSVFGGYGMFNDYEFDFDNGIGGVFPYTLELDSGFVIGAAVGRSGGILGPNVRTEIEVSHMSTSDFSGYFATGGGFVGTDPDGRVSSTNLLVNLWFDIPTNSNFMPYVGGGVGAGFASGDLTISNGSGAQFDGSDTGLAYQLGFGGAIPLNDMSYLDVGYRYRVVTDVAFDSSIAGFATTAGDISAHTVQIGVRFEF